MRGAEWTILEVNIKDNINRRKKGRIEGKEGNIYITLARLVIAIIIFPLY